jgi:hypothetical protein
MLQIPLTWQLPSKMLQIQWNMRGSKPNTVEMAASSSQMLQIARKMDRTKEFHQTDKKTQTISDPYTFLSVEGCYSML